MKKKIVFIVSIILFVLLLGSTTMVNASKWKGVVDCDHDGDQYTDNVIHEASECVIISPIPSIDIIPSVSPSLSPTPSEIPSVTPSVTPSETPTPQNQGQSGGGSSPQPAGQTSTTQAPGSPSCIIPFSAPVLNGFSEAGSGSVNFSWLESDNGIDKFSIRYGYTQNNLVYGEDNIPSSSRSITLGSLQSGAHVWAIVSAWKGGCSEDSNELDPKVH